jgi:hypothetical protein
MSDKKKEPKLHEVLAVEGDLEGQSSKVMTEAVTTFSKKAAHFQGYHKWLEMFDEKRAMEAQGAIENKEIVDTVGGKLGHVWGHFGRYLNTVAQKERTNQDARADLVVDGEVLIEDAPATLLLGLESRLKKLRDVYDVIPTHQPGVKWVSDEDRGNGVFKAEHLVTANKTEKIPQHKVLVDPTEHHPAQIERWMENIAVGVFKTEHWTSMVSPAKKAEWIGRIDKLLRAVKRARQRANNTPLVKIRVADALRKYIHAED